MRRGLASIFRPLEMGLWWIVVCAMAALEAFGLRFRLVPLWGDRIGALAPEADTVYHQEHSGDGIRHACIVGDVCNRALIDVIKDHIRVLESAPLHASLMRVFDNCAAFRSHKNVLKPGPSIYPAAHNIRANRIDPGRRAEEAVERYFDDLGIPQGSWFICIHNRDDHYLKSAFPHRDWSYHDYRDCSIDSYLQAAEHVVQSGGYVFRMGRQTAVPLPDTRSPQIIDFSVQNGSQHLEIGLIAQCSLFLGSTSGLYTVAHLFNRPVALANLVPFSIATYATDDLFIPKLLWDEKADRLLTFQESYDIGLFDPNSAASHGSFYRDHGLKVLENDAEEIRDLCVERLGRDKGKSDTSFQEDDLLQANFKKHFLSHLAGHEFMGNVGASFLRKYLHLWQP